jgi:hypothetical protein
MKLKKATYLPATVLCLLLLLAACHNQTNNPSEKKQSRPKPNISVPSFNADIAYSYVAKQVSYGPRVPGTPAQKACADWMESELKKFTDTVYRQETQLQTKGGNTVPCINLIGSVNPKATRRILLLTHWDSRPWADMDTKDRDKPIVAADDAGSGVGVLLELAKVLKENKFSPNLGIDILFTDVEDYGKDEWEPDSYCLGTQYWAAHPHIPGYKADFGILLDMVGAANAKFPQEGFSVEYAPNIEDMVWQAAGDAGYSSYFTYDQGHQITDDHVYVNRIAHIPTIDIINLSGNNITQPFAPHWHTHLDDMPIIDKNTLMAVGQTLLQAIYETAQPAS